MFFEKVLGNTEIKQILKKEVVTNQVPHAQLFVEPSQTSALPMTLAYVMYLFCKNRNTNDSCGVCTSCVKMLKLTHPDLHFFFPTKNIHKNKSGSKETFLDFKSLILNNDHLELQEWYSFNKIKTKGEIRVADIRVINKLLSLQSYEGGYKVFILWCPETMSIITSNKLLKNLEEPSSKTLFIYITKSPHLLLPTITSRLQSKLFQKIPINSLQLYFKNKFPDLDPEIINEKIIKNDNNYNLIIKDLLGDSEDEMMYTGFIDWIRLCFFANNPISKFKNELGEVVIVVPSLIDWCNNISSKEKSFQLKFLEMTISIFRHAFLTKYNSSLTRSSKIEELNEARPTFNFSNFAQRIKSENIIEICNLLNDTYFAINRYGNSKILFLDLSFSLGKLFKKEK